MVVTTTEPEKKEGIRAVLSFVWNLLLKIQRLILILSGIFVIVGITLVVLFRYFLKLDLFGMEEIITICAFWMYFIGGSYGAYERSHISADLISSYVKNDRLRTTLKAITSVITAGLCLLFLKWAYDYFRWSLDANPKTTALHIPLIIPQTAILIGFILMSFYFLVHLARDLKDASKAWKSS